MTFRWAISFMRELGEHLFKDSSHQSDWDTAWHAIDRHIKSLEERIAKLESNR